MQQFDVIIIGSGFGGAVTACRAAEAGARVLVLERGRRWDVSTYPRSAKDPWLFDVDRPEKKNGWLDIRFFKRMAVAQGAGVGGGSLCYSSVVMRADDRLFDSGWPADVSANDLRNHYDAASRMLGVQTIPAGQETVRHQLLRKAAAELDMSDRFESAPLAVSFDSKYNYDLEDPINKKHTKPFRNTVGRWQGTCVHLGNCDVGCDVRAKNTLDLNYLARAQQLGSDIRPSHLVRKIEFDREYNVHFDRIHSGKLVPGTVSAPKVVIAAGSLGSTELLLRCRDQFRTLTKLSQTLGKNWSANGNFLSPAIYGENDKVRQGIGPTISAKLDLMDGFEHGNRMLIEDDGFPNIWLNALRQRGMSGWLSPLGWSFPNRLRRGLNEKNPFADVMVWLGSGPDAGDGTLRMKRRWHAPWSQKLGLDWSAEQSESLIEGIIQIHRRLTQVTGGKLYVPLFWRLLRSLITVHPLGGCRMGNTIDDGVVDHRGEVFGYPNLFVIDGAMIPVPIGRNPSLTIAALAERAAEINWT